MVNNFEFMYRLMIKTHNVTGLKYLCITSKENWQSYTGSGVKWKRHLNKHGNDISTELLFETEDYQLFVERCIYYSALLNVALNEEFANAIPEHGYDNCDGNSEPNVVTWWRYASDDLKREVIEKRKPKQVENHWSTGESFNEITQVISDKLKVYWDAFDIDSRREMTKKLRAGANKFYSEMGDDYWKWKEKTGNFLREYVKSQSFETLSERNRINRLNLSEEKRQARKEKIQQVFATGKHDHIFERYSKDRLGIDNPAAKVVCWFGERMTLKDFKTFIKENNIDKKYAEIKLEEGIECYREYEVVDKVYDTITCPHCGKSTNKKPSGFKRRHFDNCKEINEKTSWN